MAAIDPLVTSTYTRSRTGSLPRSPTTRTSSARWRLPASVTRNTGRAAAGFRPVNRRSAAIRARASAPVSFADGSRLKSPPPAPLTPVTEPFRSTCTTRSPPITSRPSVTRRKRKWVPPRPSRRIARSCRSVAEIRSGAATRGRTARSASSALAGSFNRSTSTRARSPTMWRGRPSGELSSTSASGSAAIAAVTSPSGSSLGTRSNCACSPAESAAVNSNQTRIRCACFVRKLAHCG